MPSKLRFAVGGRWAAYAALVLLAISRSVTANVTLDMSADQVFLADGTILKCTLLCRGKESVVVLVGNQERTLFASSVLRIERGQPAGERKSFKTEPVAGHEQITGLAAQDAPPAPPDKAAVDKPARAKNRRLRGKKDKEGVTPSREKTKRKKKQNKKPMDQPKDAAGQTSPRLPAGIDAKTVRKLIKEAKPDDLIKALEELKKKFGADN